MQFNITNPDGKYHIYSIACNDNVKEDLIRNNLSYWFLDNGKVSNSEGATIPIDHKEKLCQLDNYDVVAVFPNGRVFQLYDDSTNNNVFFTSDKCNSNCIMCPTGEFSRRNGEISSSERLIDLAKHIPSDTDHITITGGEPFMMGKDIFPFFKFLKNKFLNTEFLLLTNGRALSIPSYCHFLQESIPNNILFGIPVHAASEKLHDYITQAPGSFRQTIYGINNLLALQMQVEIRIVISRINKDDIRNLANLIVREFSGVDHVCLMAMEMTGNAYHNREQVWIPYKQAFNSIKDAINTLIKYGIDVRLYNFPLCTVDSAYWTLCRKSITPSKIRYTENCNRCRMINACGGLFSGTFNLEMNELEPIV